MLADLGLSAVDGVLFDLGVSSMQLDVRERGFAYAEDAPLDMRMDDTDGPTAADVLNTYPAAELARVLRRVRRGAVRPADRRARSCASAPGAVHRAPARLVELLYAAIPAAARRTGGHPAKRTFQALRIEVNDELAVLRAGAPGRDRRARASAAGSSSMSYHSLEDRMVKQAFAAATRVDVPPDLPFVPEEHEPALRLVTRGAEKADPGGDRGEPARGVGPAACGRARPPREGSSRDEQHRRTDHGAGCRGSPRRRSSGPG